MIRLCRVAPDVRTLGPGVRFCVWVQGCPRRCPGAREQQMQIDDQGVLIIGLRKHSRSGPAHTEGAKDETGEGQQTAGL